MNAHSLTDFDTTDRLRANPLRCRETRAPYFTMANHVVTNFAGGTVIVATVNPVLENPDSIASDMADALNRVCI